MDTMQLLDIIKIVIFSISIVTAIISTIIACKKKKDKGEQNISFFDILNNNIIEYMQCAETLYSQVSSVGSKTGVLKESDVLNKIKIDCLSNGVEYNEDIAKNKIKELIEFSKTVNK